MKTYTVTVTDKKSFQAAEGISLLKALNDAGIFLDAPCGGEGKCRKCKVILKGEEVLACRILIHEDLEIRLPESAKENVVQRAATPDAPYAPLKEGYQLAFDIGTTTVVGYLLDKTDGRILKTEGMLNPQASFGADVISRIREAMGGSLIQLRNSIREALTSIAEHLCEAFSISPEDISAVCVVGNPCMQQLFLGIMPDNLATVPFAPVLTKTEITKAADVIPCLTKADLLTVPDISGYVGADTLACVMAVEQYEKDDVMLMLDIGTNGEMVLGNKDRMAACSTAAGPALEGADIRFGMRAKDGAIDHVYAENGELKVHVIGETEAEGICGSGLIDAVAAALETEKINMFGRIQEEEEAEGSRIIRLTDKVYLTQDDIRKVQLAKGAVAAGIELMMASLKITTEDIKEVSLAGAFGSYIDPASACRIGLIPEDLLGRTAAIGNAAGSGSVKMVKNHEVFLNSEKIKDRITFLELAALPEFQETFVEHMNFPGDEDEM